LPQKCENHNSSSIFFAKEHKNKKIAKFIQIIEYQEFLCVIKLIIRTFLKYNAVEVYF